MTRLSRLAGIGWLRAPASTSPDEERHASWLELFFDLVFVLALSGIIKRLDDDATPTVAQIGVALGVYVLVQWAWIGQSFYDTRFDLDDVPHRLLVLTATAGAGTLALGIRASYASLLLPVGYLVVRGALIVMYLRVAVSDQPARSVAPVYFVGFGTGWLLWLTSLALPATQRPYVWITAMVVELLTPWLGHRRLSRYPVHTTHLPERIGQFTVILLGSTLTEFNNAVPLPDPPGRALAAAAIAFLAPACVWWVYTTFLTSRLAVPRLGSGQAYSYLHAPNGAAILFLGWALGQAIRSSAESHLLSPTVRLVLGGSILTWMVCGLALQWFSFGSVTRKRTVTGVLAALSVIAVAALVPEPLPALVLVAAILVTYSTMVSRQIVARTRSATA